MPIISSCANSVTQAAGAMASWLVRSTPERVLRIGALPKNSYYYGDMRMLRTGSNAGYTRYRKHVVSPKLCLIFQRCEMKFQPVSFIITFI